MGRNWDDIDVYQGDDSDREQFEATHSGGFQIIGGSGDSPYDENDEQLDDWE
jgi:hypothetical protein